MLEIGVRNIAGDIAASTVPLVGDGGGADPYVSGHRRHGLSHVYPRKLGHLHVHPGREAQGHRSQRLHHLHILYGITTSPLSVPAVYHCATPFGSDIGSNNAASWLWGIANNAALGYAQ